jgi:hypothetical protein
VGSAILISLSELLILPYPAGELKTFGMAIWNKYIFTIGLQEANVTLGFDFYPISAKKRPHYPF